MTKRNFEFADGKSHKFWNIELKGKQVITTFGRIGTNGQSSTKDFADPAKAEKEYDKLIKQKTSKGYMEAGDKPAAGSNSEVGLDPLLFPTMKSYDDFFSISNFIGRKITDFNPEKPPKKNTKSVFRISVEYDDDVSFDVKLQRFLECDAAESTEGLVIGNWAPEGPESAKPVVKKLAEAAKKLPALKALYFGAMSSEECEISWIENCDMSPILAAYPNLELFRVRGGNDLELTKAKHDNLRALAVEAGGLNRKTVGQICRGKFPKLEYLELWLGTPDYGGDCTVNDLQPIMSGKSFPNLDYLGFRNSEIADEIAAVLVNSPIAKQITTLDLSMGTLSDVGGEALLSLPTDGNLKRVELSYHFLSNAMMKKLKALPFVVNTSAQQEAEDWGDGEMRFVAIGE